MDVKWLIRAGFSVICVLLIIILIQSYLSAPLSDSYNIQSPNKNVPDKIDGLTIITTQPSDAVAKGKRDGRESMLITLTENNRVFYKNQTHDHYWDVDPDPTGQTTVTYVAADIIPKSDCPATEACIHVIIEQANLTTGHVEQLYSHINVLPMSEIGNGHSSRWHDVDRVNKSHYLVADLFHDRAFIVNTTSGIVTWQWNAKSDYSLSSGGDYPNDWTHINDVEELSNGRIMVSLRNQDTVAFLDREQGVIENWSLGEDDRHEILFEQHNPDYLPEVHGGPAVLVADSENNRIIEYQRVNDTWQRAWVWQDVRLTWPRDADRLPDGNTLITDSRGNRVFEVNKQNEIIWSVNITNPYEAERLGSGDESASGVSAARLGFSSRTISSSGGGSSQSVLWSVVQLVPPRVRNVLAFVAPAWMSLIDIMFSFGLVVILITWIGVEYRLSSFRMTIRMPIDGKLRSPIGVHRRK